MRFPWHSVRPEEAAAPPSACYRSESVAKSKVVPGVRFTIAKMSFERRTELMREIRELARRAEFLTASGDTGEKMDAALLQREIELAYVRWGLRAVAGLTVNGRVADPAILAEEGPEELFREALDAVRRETGLSEEDRKNY